LAACDIVAAASAVQHERINVRPQLRDDERNLTRHQAREALKRVAAGETLREIALSYNVDHSTIHRLRARFAAEA
jgi:FixJ family two-component response regulator